jgi:hypothetical protein
MKLALNETSTLHPGDSFAGPAARWLRWALAGDVRLARNARGNVRGCMIVPPQSGHVELPEGADHCL